MNSLKNQLLTLLPIPSSHVLSIPLFIPLAGFASSPMVASKIGLHLSFTVLTHYALNDTDGLAFSLCPQTGSLGGFG